MSSSDGQWEVGVAVFHDSFEDYDRWTRLGSALAALASGDTSRSLVLADTSLDTPGPTDHYDASPFCVKGYLIQRASDGSTASSPCYVLGNELWLGPSSNSTWDGACEPCTVYTFGGNDYTLSLLGAGLNTTATDSALNHTHVAWPAAAYAEDDAVLIRSVPLNWTPAGTFESYHYAVMPIGRYDEREGQAYMRTQAASLEGITELDTEQAYRYKTQTGVRLVTNTLQTTANQYIYRLTPVNSMDPRVRRWRASWYYRLVRARSDAIPSAPQALLTLKGTDAAGTVLSAYSHETTSPDVDFTRTYDTIDSTAEDWVYDDILFSQYDSDNDWSFGTQTNPARHAINRANRLRIELGLTQGVNSAFDVDDLVVEHAHGTSSEATGYVTLGWPVQETLSWSYREPATSRSVTLDNRLKLSVSTRNRKRRYILEGEFEHATSQLYTDLEVLLDWQRQGYPLVLRTFLQGRPNVLVGVLDITRQDYRLWSLGYMSFAFKFEEI